MDARLIRSLRGMYNQIQRRFKVGQYVGEAFTSTNGILRGCPTSVMLLNAIMMVLHRAFENDLIAESFVDESTLLSSDGKMLQKAADTIADFMALTDQKVNTKKTKCFGMFPGSEILYEGKPLERANSVKVLGATWIFREGFFELGVDDQKIDNLCSLAHRIRCSGLSIPPKRVAMRRSHHGPRYYTQLKLLISIPPRNENFAQRSDVPFGRKLTKRATQVSCLLCQ